MPLEGGPGGIEAYQSVYKFGTPGYCRLKTGKTSQNFKGLHDRDHVSLKVSKIG